MMETVYRTFKQLNAVASIIRLIENVGHKMTNVKYSGKCGYILTEVTKAQRDILKALDIQLPGKA